jgi:integrase
LVCVCFGLRISEALALRWSDVDWLNGKLHVERGIVRQQVDDVKTVYSQKQMSINGELLQVLKLWKQTTQFSTQEDWVFASPVQLGALPVLYPWVWKAFQHAAAKAGIGKLSTHTMRHKLPLLAGRCGHHNRSPAEADEAHGHSHDAQHLWRRGDRRDGTS